MSSWETLQQYGKVGIVTHLTLSWSFFLATYIFVNKSGQAARLIKYLKLQDRIPPKAGSFAIAAIIYKAVMPARLAVTAATLPFVMQYFPPEENQRVAENESKVEFTQW